MEAATLVVRGYRNLVDAELELPASGVALVGPNGHGKTNLLEALGYPVLFRSFRGALDREVAAFGGPGFFVNVQQAGGPTVSARYDLPSGRKRILVDGDESPIRSALGQWLAIAFLPDDLDLVQGGAAERRRWLDRLLSLASPAYLEALLRYRRILAHRNAALRQQDAAASGAFEPQLARAGSTVMAARLAWVAQAAEPWREELAALGEDASVLLRYRGNPDLVDPTAWHDVLVASRNRDMQRGQTQVGPHRDDVVLSLGGHALRDYGSTGQQRCAAVALRLLELESVAAARGVRPVLLVDDVFAALDGGRQERLAQRLQSRPGQRFVTAPKAAEVPAQLALPQWGVHAGRVVQEG